MAAATPTLDAVVPRAGERSMYTVAALSALAVILIGFSPTYFLKAAFGTPELNTLKHFHGVVMTMWFALFLVQARLVAGGNTALHRKLGILGIAMAALVVIVGLQAGIASARAGVTPLPSVPPLAFFVMPFGEMVVFATLFTAAIAMRKRSPWHKRLMLVATLAMLTPAFARWPVIGGLGPLAFFAAADLLIIGCMVYDKRRNGRVHPAFIASLAFLVVTQIGRLAISGTPQWMAFAKWMIS